MNDEYSFNEFDCHQYNIQIFLDIQFFFCKKTQQLSILTMLDMLLYALYPCRS